MSENTIGTPEMRQIIEISKKVINKIGIQNYKISPSNQKCRILFLITNLGQSTDGRWSTFPVLIDVEQEYVKIYILFTLEGKTYAFTDLDMQKLLLEYITLVNYHLNIGMFKFVSTRLFVRFENCMPFKFLDPTSWYGVLYGYLTNALLSYKAFGFGFVKIVDRTENTGTKDLNYLFEVCCSRFSGGTPLRLPSESRSYLEIPEEDPDRWVDVKGDFIAKLSQDQTTHLFDVENIQQKGEKFIYDNTKLLDLEEALKHGWKISIFIYKQLVNDFTMLFSKDVIFSKLPQSLIKIIVSNNRVTGYKIGFKNLDLVLTNIKFSLNEYKLSLWKQITTFNILLSSSQIFPERTLTELENLSLSSLEESLIDDRKNLLGYGGFGAVFSNKLCGMSVAVKFASQKKEDLYSSLERLKHEYMLTKAMRHPNVMVVYGLVQYKNRIAYVMQHCSGGTLNEMIKSKHKFLYEEKISLLKQIASALSFIHSKNCVHLDLKPHNIFMDCGVPYVGDFGLSASLNSDKCGEMKLGCTIYYSPPEQIRSSPPSKSSDVWAFGMTMYHLLFEQHPYGFLRDYRRIEKEAFYYLIKEQYVRPKIPEEFEKEHPIESKIMRKCWKLNPSKRPSMESVYLKLQSIT